MSDLSNITTFSGLTIESDQNTGTNNPYATLALPCLTTTQRDLLQNVTPYVINTKTVKIKEGTIIFNISVNKLQMFRQGEWESVVANVNTAPGIGLNSTLLSLPSGARNSVEAGDGDQNQIDGFIYYDTTYEVIRVFCNENWNTVYMMFTSTDSTTGSTLANKVPFIFPQGQRDAIETVDNNKMMGFTYVDTQNDHVLRTYGRNNEWYTIDKEGS